MPYKPKSPTIHDLPEHDRPRERLMQLGATSLSNAELLAIILRTGTENENALRFAERILSDSNGLHGLAQTSPTELIRIKGLGTAKVAQILAAIELGSRLAASNPSERTAINSANDAARLVMDMRYLSQEHVRVILLDSQSRVLAIPTIYIGTLNTSVLRVSELFREAITRNSPALILVHNHPAGKPDPSPEDIEFTRNFVSAGNLLDIQVIDHLIIGERDWRSLRNMGLGF